MNHLIKQFALEAFQPINDIASEGIADRRTFDQAWFQSYNQKFARLLIRECANVAADHEALDIYEEILEHFEGEQ